jgi:hypothetical protein
MVSALRERAARRSAAEREAPPDEAAPSGNPNEAVGTPHERSWGLGDRLAAGGIAIAPAAVAVMAGFGAARWLVVLVAVLLGVALAALLWGSLSGRRALGVRRPRPPQPS